MTAAPTPAAPVGKSSVPQRILLLEPHTAEHSECFPQPGHSSHQLSAIYSVAALFCTCMMCGVHHMIVSVRLSTSHHMKVLMSQLDLKKWPPQPCASTMKQIDMDFS